MPVIQRDLELEVDRDEIFKYLVSYLVTNLRAKISILSKNFISIEHGSYDTFFPKNAKKRINIAIMRSRNKGVYIKFSLDYTSYLVVSLVFIILGFVIGFYFFQQASSSLEYLSEANRNSLYSLFEKRPWLLDLLSKFIDDRDLVEIILVYIKIISIFIIGASIVSIVILALTPQALNDFIDQIASTLTAYAYTIGKQQVKERKVLEESKTAEKQSKEVKKECTIHNIICENKASNTMLCSIEGENLTLESIKRALIFLGFTINEVNEGILWGENKGSKFLADRFINKKRMFV